MNIKVLGGGCRSCEALLKAVKEAVESREINAEIEYITDMEKIMGRIVKLSATILNDKPQMVFCSQDIFVASC